MNTPVPNTRTGLRRRYIVLAGAAAVLLLLAPVAAILLTRAFIGDHYRMYSGSMEPTLHIGDLLLVNKGAYADTAPERGDLVVYDNDGDHVLKRIVALPGDVVTVRDGLVSLEGVALESRWLSQGHGRETVGSRTWDVLLTHGGGTEDTVNAPEGHVYVLGDNRGASHDSRYHGPVPIASLVGRVVEVLQSPGREAGSRAPNTA